MSYYLINPADMNVGLPVMGGDEAEVAGRWALTADRYAFTDELNLWMADLCELHLQAAISKDVGQIYVRPFGWANWIEAREVLDEDGEVVDVVEAHMEHVVGAELVDETGHSWYWSMTLLPPGMS